MARNGSGTYAKVNTFVAGATITASGHNQNWDDLATEMTNSVAADGQTPITGSLKGANGSVGTPSYGFNSDPDTGWYRIGANNLGIAAGGTKIIDIATTGISITGTFSATGAQTFTGAATFQSSVTVSANLAVLGALDLTGILTSAGVIKGPDGTKTNPAFSFSGDTDTGFYRIGANNIGISCGDTKIWDITTAGATLTGALTVSNGFTVSAGSVSLPAGSIANAALAAPGAMVFLGNLTASNSATLDFTTISSTYDDYVFEFDNILPATDDSEFWIRYGTGVGPTYQTTNYINSGLLNLSSGGTSGISRTSAVAIGSDGAGNSVGNDTGYGLSGRVTVYGVNQAGTNTKISVYSAGYLISSGAATTIASTNGIGLRQDGSALTAIRFMFESGNITSGVIRCYGLVHA